MYKRLEQLIEGTLSGASRAYLDVSRREVRQGRFQKLQQLKSAIPRNPKRNNARTRKQVSKEFAWNSMNDPRIRDVIADRIRMLRKT